MKKKAALHNLGCKVNAYETEAMRQLLEEAGYEIVPFEPGADVYVINTCTVTNIADRKSRQMLHRARRMNPQAVVVAAGCYVQTADVRTGPDTSIDIVLGNNCKKNLIEALRDFEAARAAEAGCAHGSEAGRSEDRAGMEESAGVCAGRGSDKTDAESADGAGAGRSEDGTGTEESAGVCAGRGSDKTDAESADGAGAGRSEDGTGTEESARRSSLHVSGRPGQDIRIDIAHAGEFETLSLARTEEHTRAYMKVQDGCNQFCSYCIIPYARGRVRSRALEDVVSEARTLAANGCQEIVLTGIHLSSYGSDLGRTLPELIEAVHAVEGIRRIRLGSLEPGIITEEFAGALSMLPGFCPHFHLSLQSGCDATLKRMNRHYTSEEYAQKCELLRRIFREPALTTDVIVGFPGETEEEFGQTAAFLKRLGLYETHIFKYSRRQGTRAAAMPGQIPEPVKEERSRRLIALGDENRRAFEARHAGQEAEVLFEEKCTIGGREYFTGYTKEYIRAAVPADRDYENVLLTGRLGPALEPHVFLLQRQ